MPERAAIVTGASSGIGLAIAHLLGEEGHGLTVAARRPDKLEHAAGELIGFTEAMNKELNSEGIKSVALAPGWVDTPMADFIKGQIEPGEMIRTQDIAESVRFLLRLSPNCVVGEITFQRPTEWL